MHPIARSALAVSVLALAGLVGCDHSPAAIAGVEEPAFGAADVGAGGGARRFVEELYFDLTDSEYPFSCDESGQYLGGHDGELVRMSGGIATRYAATITPNYIVNINYKAMSVGLTGVGVDSGEVFRVRMSESSNSHTSTMNDVNPWRYSLTMVGMETGRTMRVVHSGMYRVGENGIHIDRRDEKVECRV